MLWGLMSKAAENFRGYSWILVLVSGFMMFYSGLFFLGVFPIPGPRFWDGGETALLMAGLFDVAGGTGALVVISLRRARSPLNIVAILCLTGIIGDLVGGLYAIGAQIGLYTSMVNWLLARRRGRHHS